MSRSYKKSTVAHVYCVRSKKGKWYKRTANKANRAYLRNKLNKADFDPDNFAMPSKRLFLNPWDCHMDGRGYISKWYYLYSNPESHQYSWGFRSYASDKNLLEYVKEDIEYFKRVMRK